MQMEEVGDMRIFGRERCLQLNALESGQKKDTQTAIEVHCSKDLALCRNRNRG